MKKIAYIILIILAFQFIPTTNAISNHEIYVTPFPLSSIGWIYPDDDISSIYETNKIDIFGCKGEYVPAHFIVRAVGSDIVDLEIRGDSIRNLLWTLPVDVRVVKVWNQNGIDSIGTSVRGNTWVLVPELLLYDDELVRVTGTTNEVRLIDGTYKDISTPATVPVWGNSAPLADWMIKDADTLQPVNIPANTNKQFWITIYIPPDAVAGDYSGTLDLFTQGQKIGNVDIHLKVYNVVLEDSIIEYSMYYAAQLKPGVPEGSLSTVYRSEEQIKAELKNMKEHGIMNPTIYQGSTDETLLSDYMDLRVEVGMSNDIIYTLGRHLGHSNIAGAISFFEDNYNTKEIYFYGDDENYMNTPEVRAQIDDCHALGGKAFNAQKKEYAYDIADKLDCVIASNTLDPALADLYHSYGFKIMSYANPQIGMEKPGNYRRRYGLSIMQQDYDGVMDFALKFGPGIVWNDWDWVDTDGSPKYKQHVIVYPTIDGVVDTLAWEGFREGVDDTRYASTLLKYYDNPEVKDYYDNILMKVDVDTYSFDFEELRLGIISLIEQNQPNYLLYILIVSLIIVLLIIFRKRIPI